jgi:hypothetical protein
MKDNMNNFKYCGNKRYNIFLLEKIDPEDGMAYDIFKINNRNVENPEGYNVTINNDLFNFSIIITETDESMSMEEFELTPSDESLAYKVRTTLLTDIALIDKPDENIILTIVSDYLANYYYPPLVDKLFAKISMIATNINKSKVTKSSNKISIKSLAKESIENRLNVANELSKVIIKNNNINNKSQLELINIINTILLNSGSISL